jgi:biopolymer transport protein ExbD
MAKRKKGSDLEVDMTPMIDCVFLLIIFFVISTQIVVDVIPLDPPFALEVLEEPLVDKAVINVNELGVHVGGKIMHTWGDLKENMQVRALQFDIEDDGFSEMTLYIRGDTVSQWKYIQEVLAIANECKPQIYKTDFAAQIGEKHK